MLNTIVSLRPDLLEGKDLEALSDEDVEAFFKLALESQGQTGGAAMSVPAQAMPGAMTEALAMRLQALEQRAHLAETRAMMREAISGSTLPPAAKEKLSVDFARRAHFTEAEVRQAIREEAAYLARFVESGRVTGLGDLPRIEAGESRAEKTSKMLDACFDPNDRSVQSLRECYVAITGDKRITGATHNCDRSLLREALDGATLGQVLGNAITRRMIADYNTTDILDVWRNLAQVVPVNDFRTQERLRWGGYGDLPAVAESGGYAALASPGDEKTTYAVSKFGGTEQITLEMIVNDDMSVVQQIPRKLARASCHRIVPFCFDERDDPAAGAWLDDEIDGVDFADALGEPHPPATVLADPAFAFGIDGKAEQPGHAAGPSVAKPGGDRAAGLQQLERRLKLTGIGVRSRPKHRPGQAADHVHEVLAGALEMLFVRAQQDPRSLEERRGFGQHPIGIEVAVLGEPRPDDPDAPTRPVAVVEGLKKGIELRGSSHLFNTYKTY